VLFLEKYWSGRGVRVKLIKNNRGLSSKLKKIYTISNKV
jgi:hypothetical protein